MLNTIQNNTFILFIKNIGIIIANGAYTSINAIRKNPLILIPIITVLIVFIFFMHLMWIDEDVGHSIPMLLSLGILMSSIMSFCCILMEWLIYLVFQNPLNLFIDYIKGIINKSKNGITIENKWKK